jgi:hypothetical protein
VETDEVISQLEQLHAEYQARIAVLEAEKERLYHALGTLAFEVKVLKGSLAMTRTQDLEAE